MEKHIRLPNGAVFPLKNIVEVSDVIIVPYSNVGSEVNIGFGIILINDREHYVGARIGVGEYIKESTYGHTAYVMADGSIHECDTGNGVPKGTLLEKHWQEKIDKLRGMLNIDVVDL